MTPPNRPAAVGGSHPDGPDRGGTAQRSGDLLPAAGPPVTSRPPPAGGASRSHRAATVPPVSVEASNAAIGRRFLAALAGRDWPALRGLLADDVQWTIPGAGAPAGTVQGATSVLNRARSIADSSIRTETLQMLIGRTGVTLTQQHTGSGADGRHRDGHLATVLTVDRGKIRAIDTYLPAGARLES